MLERLSERAGADPAIGLLAALVRVDLAPDDGASAKAPRRDPEDFRPIDASRHGWKWRVADWIASDVNPYPSDPNSTGKPKGRLDPDAHADAVIRALESRCEALGVDPALLPAAALQVAGIAAARGAEQRKAGRLDDARQTAACLSAFGKMLARRDPNEAAFHVVLSVAFEQESKNAWQSQGLRHDRSGAAKGAGRSLYRVTSRPPKHGRANRGRGSPGQAGRSRLQTKEAGGRKPGRRSYFVPTAHLA